jgi:hypothetical protein
MPDWCVRAGYPFLRFCKPSGVKLEPSFGRQSSMKVGDVMTPDVDVVAPGDTLRTAA